MLALRFGLVEHFAAGAEALPIVWTTPGQLRRRARSPPVDRGVGEANQVIYFTCHPETPLSGARDPSPRLVGAAGTSPRSGVVVSCLGRGRGPWRCVQPPPSGGRLSRVVIRRDPRLATSAACGSWPGACASDRWLLSSSVVDRGPATGHSIAEDREGRCREPGRRGEITETTRAPGRLGAADKCRQRPVALGQAEGIADLRVGQVQGEALEPDGADTPDDLERVDVLLGVVAEELGRPRPPTMSRTRSVPPTQW